MKKKKFILLVFLFFSFFIFILFIFLIQDSQNKLTLKAKSMIPKEYRMIMKNSINFYLYNVGIDFKHIPTYQKETTKGKKINIKEFNNKFMDYQGPRAYISYFDDNFYIVSGTGIVAYIKIENLYKEKNIHFKSVKTNLKNLIKFKDFFKNSNYGIKGMMIANNEIYLAFSNRIKENCYKISVIKSELNVKKLDFSYIFNPKECVKKKNIYGEFQPIQSGGMITDFDKDYFLLSIGEFRFRDLAQDDNSVFGKIIKINKNTGEFSIISKGHRNVQGLYFNKDKKIVISTEHGPKGGDEININLNVLKQANFGWPVSSYGEHYPGMAAEDAYIKAPLHKSHSKYGFIEPIKYFVPSIGITQITEAPNSFGQFNNENYFYASMAYVGRENSLSVHQIVFSRDYKKIIYEDKIKLGERIRDILFVKEKKILIAYLEKRGSIILISY